ncbi:hypothetical protein [Nocardioides sp. LML1-1-1.1]|uniref:hypothetical protein n=1 Tax=Nocardioides sp. LML1-1-1.1 TaxID=3135248 RepID=UPI00344A0F11
MSRKGLRLWWRTGVLALLVVGLGVFALVRVLDDPAPDRAAVLLAGRGSADAFFSLDYRRVEKNVDRVVTGSTGRFRKEYASRRDQIVADVKKQQLVIDVTVPPDGVALEFLTERRAQVLVSVDLARTTAGTKAGTERFRARISLRKVGDRWLASDVRQVP